MFQSSVFKKRKVLRRNEINRLLQEQDQASFKFLRTELDTGSILDLRVIPKSSTADTIKFSIINKDDLSESRLKGGDKIDLLLGTTNPDIFDTLQIRFSDATIILFENIDPNVCVAEFCKIISSMKTISSYKYVMYDDVEYFQPILKESIQNLLKEEKIVLFPVEYTDASNNFLQSDIPASDKREYFSLQFPVKNVSVSNTFLTTSHVFMNTQFEKYGFSVERSLFYSFLKNKKCQMTKKFHLQK